MSDCLRLEHVSVAFQTEHSTLPLEAVRDVSLEVASGEILAIVGESGCGKSVLCRAILRLLPYTATLAGAITVAGQALHTYSEKKMQSVRGSLLSMIFQDTLTSLHPSLPVGKQIEEVFFSHCRISRQEAYTNALELLQLVGIDDPAHCYQLFPYALSGGIRQRCVLAIALALKPKFLLADEPTTALDVTIQIHILDLLRQLAKKRAMGIVLVTHDLGVVARIADRVAVMYAGKIVEIGTAEEIFYDPRHPYTWGLLRAMPALAMSYGLQSMPGRPPRLQPPPQGDAFAARNPWALEKDFVEMPPFFSLSPTHKAATWLLDPRAPTVERPISIVRKKHAASPSFD